MSSIHELSNDKEFLRQEVFRWSLRFDMLLNMYPEDIRTKALQEVFSKYPVDKRVLEYKP